MQRRDFLKNSSLLASALATGATTFGKNAPTSPASNRELYELRAYRLKPGSAHASLDAYLEKAIIPALNQSGIGQVGVFNEIDPKDGPALFVLIPYLSPETFLTVAAELNADPGVQAAGAEYLDVGKDNPAFERIDSWLLLAFAGLPRMEVPPASLSKADRIFELRTYESFSELKALKKVEMFNSGEIDLMRELKMGPVFFGQGLAGSNLPHLTYMLSASDAESHKAHWAEFRKHPTWEKMKNDPQYADAVSKITSRMLKPTGYSQI